MIITLTSTTSSKVAARLVRLREEGGAVALGRVLTLIISAPPEHVERAVDAANDASREHPCRVLVVSPQAATEGDADLADGLDAEIRVGGDAGASEVIVLRPRGGAATELDSLVMPLLLPDAPIVTWWPATPPDSPSADPLGAMAQRRITDALECSAPIERLLRLAEDHAPGDTDLAWARATLWRGLIAAALDEPPFTPVLSITIRGNTAHPSLVLLGAWLRQTLDVPVTLEEVADAPALTGVVLHRENGDVVMERPVDSTILKISEPSGVSHRVSLPLRTLSDSLIEDLRRLDPDDVYGEVLTTALPALVGESAG
ncbi:OpcA protein [Serinibacter arcticus]|uniref:OpcA protein n=1 Tax=Serinibacter arcticus TaxID=1655435 RepID=A0A2U1ZRT5_9MICO|nr:glucose-6-phosphate dehydrogenase assembly protein OpcA [Serinibacter arcticus]PWD49653.1 OpcA protein [Serinibacter arcticus]